MLKSRFGECVSAVGIAVCWDLSLSLACNRSSVNALCFCKRVAAVLSVDGKQTFVSEHRHWLTGGHLDSTDSPPASAQLVLPESISAQEDLPFSRNLRGRNSLGFLWTSVLKMGGVFTR